VSSPLDRSHWRADPFGHTTDGHGLTVLDEATCFDLLGRESVGRLGFSAQALPVILPVNFVLQGRTIVFSSEDGEKLRAAEDRAVACFEIDWFDPIEHDGWSVLATGRLEPMPVERATLLIAHPVGNWALDGQRHFVELPIEIVSGRRLRRR